MDHADSLWDWLLKSGKGYLVLLLLTVCVCIADLFLGVIFRVSWSSVFIFGSQCVLIMVVLSTLGQRVSIANGTGTEAVNLFWRAWPGVWFAWFILYAALCLKEFSDLRKFISEGRVADWINVLGQCILHILNNAATYYLLLCYRILADPPPIHVRTTEGQRQPFSELLADRTSSRVDAAVLDSENAQRSAWLAIFVVFTLIEIVTRVVCHQLGMADADLNLLFAMISGCMGGLATALLVGRLSSLLLNIGTGLSALLLLFAVIQPLFDLITPTPEASTLRLTMLTGLVSLALLGKILLFCVVQWLVRSDRLLFYMAAVGTLTAATERQRRDFLDGFPALDKSPSP